MDLSLIYGQNDERISKLRSFKKGKLKMRRGVDGLEVPLSVKEVGVSMYPPGDDSVYAMG